jgi:uncharacterized membrane protein
MKKNVIYLMALFLFIGISACSNDSEDDLIDQMDPDPDPITYSANVKTIIDNNCNNCHSDPTQNGAPISLVTYAQVRNSAENGALINRIQTQEGGVGAMPLGGPRLPQTLIDVVIQWQADGFLEN